MIKTNATKEQIKLIKAALKKHNLKTLSWQAIAARPAKIEEFLKETGMRS